MANKEAIITLVILIILTIGLIIYSFYLFEAYRNGWFPFLTYQIEVPDNAVRLITQTTERSETEIETLTEIAKDALAANCCFYASKEAIPLTGNQQVLGNCDPSECP